MAGESVQNGVAQGMLVTPISSGFAESGNGILRASGTLNGAITSDLGFGFRNDRFLSRADVFDQVRFASPDANGGTATLRLLVSGSLSIVKPAASGLVSSLADLELISYTQDIGEVASERYQANLFAATDYAEVTAFDGIGGGTNRVFNSTFAPYIDQTTIGPAFSSPPWAGIMDFTIPWSATSPTFFNLKLACDIRAQSPLASSPIFQAGCDFGNTVQFVGVTSVLDQNGSTIANWRTRSASGFSYGQQGIVAGIPEPHSWALLVSGFGLAGTMLRRQRRRGSVAA